MISHRIGGAIAPVDPTPWMSLVDHHVNALIFAVTAVVVTRSVMGGIRRGRHQR